MRHRTLISEQLQTQASTPLIHMNEDFSFKGFTTGKSMFPRELQNINLRAPLSTRYSMTSETWIFLCNFPFRCFPLVREGLELLSPLVC